MYLKLTRSLAHRLVHLASVAGPLKGRDEFNFRHVTCACLTVQRRARLVGKIVLTGVLADFLAFYVANLAPCPFNASSIPLAIILPHLALRSIKPEQPLTSLIV